MGFFSIKHFYLIFHFPFLSDMKNNIYENKFLKFFFCLITKNYVGSYAFTYNSS